jgi:hypothetical protein
MPGVQGTCGEVASTTTGATTYAGSEDISKILKKNGCHLGQPQTREYCDVVEDNEGINKTV